MLIIDNNQLYTIPMLKTISMSYDTVCHFELTATYVFRNVCAVIVAGRAAERPSGRQARRTLLGR